MNQSLDGDLAQARANALAEFAILDSPPEPEFDDIVNLAALVCETPVALVSLIDLNRQWFKARVGFEACETSLDKSVCVHALSDPGPGLLIIPDLSEDPRTRDNPLVTDHPHIRFYAGARLVTDGGQAIGMLCVIDHLPRPGGLTPAQRTTVLALADQVMSQLEERRSSAEQADIVKAKAGETDGRKPLSGGDAEARYKALFSSTAQGFCIIEMLDGPDGPLSDCLHLEANAAFAAYTGLQDAVGKRLRELVGADEVDWGRRYRDVLQTGAPIRFEQELTATERLLEIEAHRIEPSSRRQVAVLVTDITARRQSETDLSRLNESLEARIEERTVERDLIRIDTALSELVERFRTVDTVEGPALVAAELIGITLGLSRAGYVRIGSPDEVIEVAEDWTAPGQRSAVGVHRCDDGGPWGSALRQGETVVDDVTTDPRTASAAEAFQAFDVGAVTNLVIENGGDPAAMLYLHRAQAHQWTDDELSFARRVTDRTQVEIARRRADRDLRSLNASLEEQVAARTQERDLMWQTAPDLMLEIDFDGVFRRVNPAWTQVLGYTGEDLLGQHVNEFVLPDDHAATTDAYGDAAAGHAPRIVNRYRHKDGSIRWISWAAAPAGNMTYATGRDVTTEREQQAELARAQDQLRQAQKMEAIGQLTGGIAHDFNNLLAGISGSLELMNSRISQGRIKDVEKYMVAAQGATRRAAALTHRLLAFSRQQTLAPKATDINDLVSGMLELIQRTVGPNIHVDAAAMPGLWVALVDQPQLENALLNLCINARDAMPDGGSITIETANRWIDRHGSERFELPEGEYVSLTVSDTGSGMPADVVAKAFDPFFTTKPSGRGTGLGLSMIYGFAKQSGGHVRIYSELGEGTSVCIHLPRHRGKADKDDLGVGPAAMPNAKAGETVLVVDDEATVRMLVTDVLQELGYTSIEASDGPGGLRLLQSDARIDLLVTDLGLPGNMNGRAMVDAARKSRPDLKVLFITGFAENALINNGQLEPGIAVLTKPFAVEILAIRIRELIAK